MLDHHALRIAFMSPLLTMIIPFSAQAEGKLTLEEALRQARQSHPDLVYAGEVVEAQESQIAVFDTALSPRLALDGGISYGATPYLMKWDEPQGTLEVGLSGGWTLTDFGRTSKRKRATRESVNASRLQLDVLERDIALSVAESYFQALAAQELVSVAQVNFDAEERHREEAEQFHEAGQMAAIEVARAKTQEARAQTELVRAKTTARRSLVYLARAMGVEDIPESVKSYWPEIPDVDVQLEKAFSARGEFAVADSRTQASELMADAAEAALQPTLDAGARVAYGSRGFDEWAPNWMVGLTLAWPLYDGGASSAEADVARAEARANQAVTQQLRYMVAAEVKGEKIALATAHEELKAAYVAKMAAKVELRLAEGRWKEGLGSGIELADAQARLTATDADHIVAKLNQTLAWVRLRRALGENLQ